MAIKVHEWNKFKYTYSLDQYIKSRHYEENCGRYPAEFSFKDQSAAGQGMIGYSLGSISQTGWDDQETSA